MPAAVVLVLALLFGAADQYLGSFSAHPWGADISGLSAPWLVLPFLAGAVQRSPRGAAVCGMLATLLALVGYCLMTVSPLENAHPSVAGVVAFVQAGNWRWFLGGLLTGPVGGWLGQLWRHERVTAAGVATAVLLVLEPLVRLRVGLPVRSMGVAVAEAGTGACAVLLVLSRRRAHLGSRL